MGTPPILPPVPAGDHCSVCWGVGKVFGSDSTPNSVEITFENIQKGPDWIPALGEPIDGTFTVLQDVSNPCIFRTTSGPINSVFIFFGVGSTGISGTSSTGGTSFAGAAGECALVIGNAGVFTLFEGGTATIRIPVIE